MKNLAGAALILTDDYVTRELMAAEIPLVCVTRNKGEVAASITGKLGEFTFTRAWYYWVVKGRVPLAVAQEMYSHPVGRKDIRVDGFSGGIEPRKRAVRGYIHGYHIDSQEGLNIFVETMKKHGLV